MAGTTPLSQADLRSAFVTAYLAAAGKAANTNIGATMGAVANAVSQVGEELDGRVEDVAALARASTSNGPNIDSFWLPFGIKRISAVASSGVVTLGINSPSTGTVSFAPGLIIQTKLSSGQSIQFVVVPSTLSGYVGSSYDVTPGQTTVDAAVVCLAKGSIGNVLAGTITQVYSSGGSGSGSVTPSSVTNALAFTNGSDAESDVAFGARATLTQKSGRVGTRPAILAAVAGVRTDLTYSYGEYVNPDGSPHAAHFSVIVDVLGTSGGPGSTLLAEIAAAIDGGTGPSGTVYPQVRGAGSTRDIVGPNEVPLNVASAIKLKNGAVFATVASAATSALGNYLDNFPLSSGVTSATVVPYSEVIAQLLAVPGVAYPSNITISAGGGSPGFSDISVGFGSRPVVGTLTFTPE